ncbi:MAG: NmrA/HSCARG family protein [Gaiellaceae bacterium]
MADKKLIAVVGATGAQGGGLARAILTDPHSEFAVRGVTRNPESDNAKTLAAQGAELVAADLDDEASLAAAFEGAYGAYCLTNFWEHFSGDKELEQAGNLARAAKHAGVEHVIWSTFEDTRDSVPLDDDRMPTLQGRYKVAHFDAKAEGNQGFIDAGLATTFLLTSFYWENFIFFGNGPARGEDGVLAVTYPLGDKKLPSMAVEDIGKCAYGLFKAGDAYLGKTVGIAGEHPTGSEIAAAFTKVLGEEVRYNDVPADVFRGFGFPGADDVGNMFQYKRDFNEAYCAARSLEFSRLLNPELQTLDQWLAANKDRVPVG